MPATRTEGDAAHPTRAFYKAKAIELYAWGRTTLVPDGARVADGIHKGGPEFHDHLYNQATYLGAACLLHRLTGEARYLADARKAADYVRDTMCRSAPDGTRLLPVERGPEQGVYAAIFAQYMDLLVHDRGQKQYLPWLRANIRAGWQNRDRTRNLQNASFGRPLRPGADVQSYDASALPALQLLFELSLPSVITLMATEGDLTLDGIKGALKVKAADALADLDTAEATAYNFVLDQAGVATITVTGDTKKFMKAVVK